MPRLEPKLLAIEREEFERLALGEDDKVLLRSQFVSALAALGDSKRLWIFHNNARTRELLRAA